MARVLKLAGLVIGAVAMLWLAVGPTPVHTVVATLVQVVNPDSNSVSTHDAGQLQPVTGFCETSGSADCNIYTVPAGKRLVVEQFSYEFSTDGLTVPVLVRAVGTITLSFSPVFGGCAPGTCVYADTRSVRLYLDAGQTLDAVAFFSAGNTFPVRYDFSGFLSDK